MQVMQRNDRPLPACRDGHAARLMLDRRAVHCGGGYFVECACGKTGRNATPGEAIDRWHIQQGQAIPPRHRARVLQLRRNPA